MSKRKSMDHDKNLNKDITQFLLELGDYERNTNRNVFKYNAYRKAAAVISTYHKRIESGAEAKQLKGVGEKIANKIDEFLRTGTLEKLEKIRKDDTNVTVSLFTRVSGIGPKKALDLYAMGFRTIEDLRNNQDKLTYHQKLGLKYFEDLEQKIHRSEIDSIEKFLKKCARNMQQEYTITTCGSYRRGAEYSGDIDVLITHPDCPTKAKEKQKKLLQNFLDVLTKKNFICDTIAMGDSKFMGICRLEEHLPAHRLDIRFCPLDEYACGILYFTGSPEFNRSMRQTAIDKKFILNEHYLRPVGATGKPGEPCPISCERDVFDYLGMKYVKPEDRNV